MLDDVGYDDARARFVRAPAQLARKAVKIFGVNMTSAEDGPTAVPQDWGDGFGRKPTADNYVDRNVPAIVSMARAPLLLRACAGQSVRVVDPKRMCI
eukprot:1094580-Pyramimonas_sp.AAC.1